MLIYLAAPYSQANDKDYLMAEVMTFSGDYMLKNPGHHLVSPLFNHFSFDKVPGLGSDWEFWKGYSFDLLKRCDQILVMRIYSQTWNWEDSKGVKGELEFARQNNIFVRYTEIFQHYDTN